MASLDTNRGAKRAREAREELGLGEGPLPDILQVIEQRGGAHVLVLELPEGVAGAYFKRPGMPLLVVRGTEFVPRQRFTLAHEFGHFRMGHETVIDKPETIGRDSRDPHEVQANAFASEFLVPKQAIKAWAARRPRKATVTLEDVVVLSCEYGVSAKMMRIRLSTAGCLPDEALCDRLDAEIDEGLHHQLFERLGLEPLADELAAAARHLPRIPTSVRQTKLGDLLAGECDAAGLADRLGCEADDVRRMLADLGLDQLVPVAL